MREKRICLCVRVRARECVLAGWAYVDDSDEVGGPQEVVPVRVERVEDLASAFGGGELGREVDGGGRVERGELPAAGQDQADRHAQEQVQSAHLATQRPELHACAKSLSTNSCRVVCPRPLNRGGGKRQWERCRELESQEVGFDHAREEQVGQSVVLLGRRIAEDHRKRQQLVRQQRAIIAIITIIVVVLLRRLFDREPVL